jgi:hypothetical protein
MARKLEFGPEMKNDIKSREDFNFDIISQLYHPLKNDIKIVGVQSRTECRPWNVWVCIYKIEKFRTLSAPSEIASLREAISSSAPLRSKNINILEKVI